jgi:hypothetical protein
VTLDVTTFTIMRAMPREVDPTVYAMATEDPGAVSFSSVGGLNEQIRELREVIELPLTNPDLFKRVGIKPPKGVLLYGPPGTGKTLLARALACNLNATFLKVVASAIVDKYIGAWVHPSEDAGRPSRAYFSRCRAVLAGSIPWAVSLSSSHVLARGSAAAGSETDGRAVPRCSPALRILVLPLSS